ncbi:MAG: hypothetical protein JXR05_11080 [Flavobacteriaceae bacterium]
MSVPNTPFKHVVVMMFENRSFDSMLGFLYKDNKNKSPLGHSFEGLTGKETNPDSNGKDVSVYEIDAKTPDAYHMPRRDPGEGFANTNCQLFGAPQAPFDPSFAPNQGFITDFAKQVANKSLEDMEKAANANTQIPIEHIQYVQDLDGVDETDIMGMYSPETLPILNGLAKHYAVCDHWYCSAPTETLPNRAFTHMGTSEGNLYDEVKSYSAKSIFMHMAKYGKTWGIYGNNGKPYTVPFCEDIPGGVADAENGETSNQPLPAGCQVGSFYDFVDALETNSLPDYTFLEPTWGHTGNSQHPNYNVAAGEQYLLQIYNALKASNHWEDTLLVITYDEHGGCYDHVTPPNGAASPATSKAFGFKFDRFGVRVPTVLVSPWIEAGTVYRTKGETPLDHTSILATLEEMFNLPALTARDKAASDILDVATLKEPRKDTPMKGVIAPKSNSTIVIKDHASQIQHMHAAALTNKHNRETGENKETPHFSSDKDVKSYINDMHDRYYSYSNK